MYFFLVVAVVVLIFCLIASQFLGLSFTKDKGLMPVKARPILTAHEQPTYLRLREALPDCVVLTQVACPALLTTAGHTTRSKFNRSRADFVVMDNKFQVLAVVELDSSTHNKNYPDRAHTRDALLEEAGYRVIHYARTPDIAQIKTDFAMNDGHMSSDHPAAA